MLLRAEAGLEFRNQREGARARLCGMLSVPKSAPALQDVRCRCLCTLQPPVVTHPWVWPSLWRASLCGLLLAVTKS